MNLSPKSGAFSDLNYEDEDVVQKVKQLNELKKELHEAHYYNLELRERISGIILIRNI